MTITTRTMALIGAAGLTAAALAGCSSGSSSSSATSASPTEAPTTASPSGSSDTLCTSEAIVTVLPQGSQIEKFDCETVAGTEWAAVRVTPGPTVFFLKAVNDTWDVSTSDEICGTASAGLPPKLLDYCSDESGSMGSSASPS
ncbi:MAG: hypothetical protein U0R64_06640 [Candidatus Nanopelagicales bacterium]